MTGCPWDLDQNFETIAPYTIEEAYEVARRDRPAGHENLREELGDLLLQVVYHSQIAAERRLFTFDDVVTGDKPEDDQSSPACVRRCVGKKRPLAKGFWEDIKARERAGSRAGVLAGVPTNLPALTRALKLQSKAAKVGFDWPSVDNVLDKITEEIAEIRSASDSTRPAEFGDLLFAVVNAARHM